MVDVLFDDGDVFWVVVGVWVTDAVGVDVLAVLPWVFGLVSPLFFFLAAKKLSKKSISLCCYVQNTQIIRTNYAKNKDTWQAAGNRFVHKLRQRISYVTRSIHNYNIND